MCWMERKQKYAWRSLRTIEGNKKSLKEMATKAQLIIRITVIEGHLHTLKSIEAT